MRANRRQSMLGGAFALMLSTVIVQVLGFIYKIPLTNMIGATGRGYFTTAYEIYVPLYAISMAGLPVAISRLVSINYSVEKYRDANELFNVSKKIFLITGILGTAVLMLLAYPFSRYVLNDTSNIICIISVAPSIFFCCMMSSYRGYYEGLGNMSMTAVSQVLEVIGKIIFGLGLAYVIVKKGLSEFNTLGTVFGKAAVDKEAALTIIYPYSAAGAIAGVTFGTILGYLYLVYTNKRVGGGISKEQLMSSPQPLGRKALTKTLIATAAPIAANTLILNLSNLIDVSTVKNRMYYVATNYTDQLLARYSGSIPAGSTPNGIANYLYGVYGTVLDFKTIVPMITMSLGVSVLPTLSAAWKKKDHLETTTSIQSVFQLTMLISFPAGIGMGVLAEPILKILYGSGSAKDMIPVAVPLLMIFGFMSFIFAASSPLSSMLQAIGRTDISLKSMLVAVVCKIVLNYILVGNPRWNIYGAAVSTVVCYLIMVIANVVMLKKITGVKISFIDTVLKPLICGIICGICASVTYKLLTVFGTNIIIATVMAVLIGIISYAVTIIIADKIYKSPKTQVDILNFAYLKKMLKRK